MFLYGFLLNFFLFFLLKPKLLKIQTSNHLEKSVVVKLFEKVEREGNT